MVWLTFAVQRFQLEAKGLTFWLLKKLVVLTSTKSQLVTVIALPGQKAKPSQISLHLLPMKTNGLRALLKLGKLQPRMVTLIFKHLSMKVKKLLKKIINVAFSNIGRSVRLMINVHGIEDQPKILRTDSDSIVDWHH